MRVQHLHMNKYIRWFPVTPTYSHLCTVSSSVYSRYSLSTYSCGIRICYGVRSQAFSEVVSIALRLAPTRDDSFFGLESLTLIVLSCDRKLSPAGQQTTKHDGLYPLLSISLTMPSFVEHFQQCDDPCRIGFYTFNSLSLLLSSDSMSHAYNFFLAFKRS